VDADEALAAVDEVEQRLRWAASNFKCVVLLRITASYFARFSGVKAP